jgi:FkbM family methyltransferase
LEGYELLQRSLIEERLSQCAANPVFLDIGANIGLFSLPLAHRQPGTRVFGFEPHPSNAKCFRESIRINAFKNVGLTEAALGNATGKVSLFLDETDSGGHTTVAENLWNNRAETRGLTVESILLDDFVRQNQIENIDVIKMDVQGAEDEVLKGGAQALKKFLPDLLIEAQHEKVFQESALISTLNEISPSYRFRTMESPEFLPLENLKEISAKKFSDGVLFADYYFSKK